MIYAGNRNSIFSRAVLYGTSDGGGGTQGPHADDNIFEHITTYRHDRALNAISDGNQRGLQQGNINPKLAQYNVCLPRCFSGGRNTLSHHMIAFDNKGAGFIDAQGSHSGVYYHLVAFNNGLDARRQELAGLNFESEAGHRGQGGEAYYPAVTVGATIMNSIAYHNTCSGGRDLYVARPAHTKAASNFTGPTDPRFVVATPMPCTTSALVADARLYTNRALRTLNPHFGVVDGLKLKAGSPAIDAGMFIPGFHCDRADDSPRARYPEDDPNCVHWNGAAPDIGTYEYIPGASGAVAPTTKLGVR
jgi:hypothetical protein